MATITQQESLGSSAATAATHSKPVRRFTCPSSPCVPPENPASFGLVRPRQMGWGDLQSENYTSIGGMRRGQWPGAPGHLRDPRQVCVTASCSHGDSASSRGAAVEVVTSRAQPSVLLGKPGKSALVPVGWRWWRRQDGRRRPGARALPAPDGWGGSGGRRWGAAPRLQLLTVSHG